MTSTDITVLQWHDVKVTFPDGGEITDAIQGIGEEDSIRNAEANWDGATIERLGVRDFQ